MTWERIEVMGRSLDLSEGVKARIADPFWMMGRQWQVGEFRGDDASQPVAVEMETETVPIQTLRHGQGNGTERLWSRRSAATGAPLEARVERVDPRGNGFSGVYWSARIGHELIQRLQAISVANLVNTIQEAFRFEKVPQDLAAQGRSKVTVRLIERRGIDGAKALDDPDKVIDEGLGKIANRSLRNRATRIVKNWRVRNAPPPREAWQPSRLEYAFSLGARSNDDEIILTASEHNGGNLDWYQFDLGGRSHKLRPRNKASFGSTVVTVPAPVTYSGQPAARWWEIEDHSVHMGDIQAGPGDFARLMVAEFATSYSDDWFVVPVRAPRGSLVRVKKLKVYDNFETDPIEIEPIAVVDAREIREAGLEVERTFRLFELSGDPGPAEERAPWLFIPPTLASSMESLPIERVEFSRDEGANLAWAIERTVEGPLGRAFDRGREWFASSENPAILGNDQNNTIDQDQAWRFRLTSELPPVWWIPLIPRRIDDSGQMRLRRGRMYQWEEINESLTGSQGSLLGEREKPFYVDEEEIPRSGITVSRNWQFTRGQDGSIHLWLQNKKTPGRGERSSGLLWDSVLRG